MHLFMYLSVHVFMPSLDHLRTVSLIHVYVMFYDDSDDYNYRDDDGDNDDV